MDIQLGTPTWSTSRTQGLAFTQSLTPAPQVCSPFHPPQPKPLSFYTPAFQAVCLSITLPETRFSAPAALGGQHAHHPPETTGKDCSRPFPNDKNHFWKAPAAKGIPHPRPQPSMGTNWCLNPEPAVPAHLLFQAPVSPRSQVSHSKQLTQSASQLSLAPSL